MMKKDMQLENLMNRYFDGVRVGYEITAPARAALAERARRKKRAKFTLRLVSSFACVLILVVAVMAASGIFGGIHKKTEEGQTISYYTSADVSGKYLTYFELYELNNSVFADFEFFEYSHSATATYTAYYENDTDELMFVRVDAKVINDYGTEDLTIFIEFSKYSSYEGFKRYYELQNKEVIGGNEILYNTEYVNAEWVSSAYAQKYALKYFLDVTSPNKNSLNKYISYLI